MKACFVFQRRFTPVAHELAKELKKRGVSEFCGYVYLRRNLAYLARQQDITYSRLLLDEDLEWDARGGKPDWEYLAQLEKEYGIPFLWPYLSLDRILRYGQGGREYPYDTSPYTHEELAHIVETMAKAIIAMLDEEKPDLLVMPFVGSTGNALLYHIAKKKGIKVLMGVETRMGYGDALTEDYRTFSYSEARFEELKRSGGKGPKEKEAREYLEQFRTKPKSYAYNFADANRGKDRQRVLAGLLPHKLFDSVRYFIKLAWREATGQKRDYTDETLGSWFIDRLRRKMRVLRGYDDLYDTLGDEPYTYFPLHYEPELAILALAPYTVDQLHLIKQIAQSLPLRHKLVVKEHPTMLGYRQRAYYRQLKKIPNVLLVPPRTSSYALIKNASLITTITGTVGWEAALFGKPVVSFGDVFYNALSSVTRVREIEKLPEIIKAKLEHFEPNDEELVTFLSAMLEESKDLHLQEMWELGMRSDRDHKNVEMLAQMILEKVRN